MSKQSQIYFRLLRAISLATINNINRFDELICWHWSPVVIHSIRSNHVIAIRAIPPHSSTYHIQSSKQLLFSHTVHSIDALFSFQVEFIWNEGNLFSSWFISTRKISFLSLDLIRRVFMIQNILQCLLFN